MSPAANEHPQAAAAAAPDPVALPTAALAARVDEQPTRTGACGTGSAACSGDEPGGPTCCPPAADGANVGLGWWPLVGLALIGAVLAFSALFK